MELEDGSTGLEALLDADEERKPRGEGAEEGDTGYQLDLKLCVTVLKVCSDLYCGSDLRLCDCALDPARV